MGEKGLGRLYLALNGQGGVSVGANPIRDKGSTVREVS